MNDLMSAGVHRLWKAALIGMLAPRAGETVLDVAGGTGDVARAIVAAAPGARFQFERLGYFCLVIETEPSRPVFSRTISLKDTWAKEQSKG